MEKIMEIKTIAEMEKANGLGYDPETGRIA